jgi:hypothetical protein
MGAQNQVHGKELLKVQVQGQPKNLVILRDNGSTKLFDAHPLVEGFNAEHGTNLTVVSHKVADVALTVGGTWRRMPVFAVDASIAYEKSGTKLGKEIVFSAQGEPKIALATGKFKGEKDVALVALGVTSADFKKDGNSFVLDVPENRLISVPNFPGSDGWYMPHAETGVPQGRQVGQSSDARYLYRLDDSSYVGLLVRNGIYYDYHYNRQGVYANRRASYRLGVVAEVPDADIAKIEAILRPLSKGQSGGDAAKIKALLSAPVPAQTAAKTVVELPGVSAEELRGLLGRFREDLEILGSSAKDELLAAGRKLETMLSEASLKE